MCMDGAARRPDAPSLRQYSAMQCVAYAALRTSAALFTRV